MGIKNLTDQKVALDTDNRGRAVRLGTLQKGRKEGHGTNIKLFDLDHFVFRPNADGKQGEKMSALFQAAYGNKPYEIPDVRIPVSLAGNFKIEDCAWLTSGKHTEKGSMFMARSDGEWVLQARDNATGRVKHYEQGQLAHATATKDDPKSKKPGYIYGNNIYPWQQSMAIDLILPAFNRLLHKERIAGQGIVTLITHSTYDIPTLIREYHSILEEWAALMADPRDPHEQDRARRHLPLRNLPIRLFRQVDHISTPDYRKGDNGKPADPSNRLNSTRSLLHWQVAPEFADAMQEAMDKRTNQFLLFVANSPYAQLPAGQRVANVNAALFGDPEPQAQLPAAASTPTLWEQWANDDEAIIDGETSPADEEDTVLPGNDPGPMDWRVQALEATTLDTFTAALYQLHKDRFDDAPAAKLFYHDFVGSFSPANNAEALAVLEKELAEDGLFEAVEAHAPPTTTTTPVAAKIKAVQSQSEPSGNTDWDGKPNPSWRNRLAANPKPTVGTVASMVPLGCGYYRNEDHVMACIEGMARSEKLSVGDALALYDQLIERAMARTAVPA